jgi:glucose/arabinose dehydrogenase
MEFIVLATQNIDPVADVDYHDCHPFTERWNTAMPTMKQLIFLLALFGATACQPAATRVAPFAPTQDTRAVETAPTMTPILNASGAATDTAPSNTTPLQIRLTPILAELDRPGHVFALPDGTPAVIEQIGVVRRLTDGSVWLDMRDLVDANSSERGLFTVAFSPFQAELFVSYTRASDSATVVSRMPIIDNQPDITGLSLVIAIPQPYPNHNGGFIAFGPDQYLYVATGDGGSGNDPQNFAQNTQSLLGKVLRLDVRDGRVPYAIPTGQPVQADWLPEIVAIGLRNPWRFGFMADQSIWIADVGQNKLEELNVVSLADLPTTNFGWRLREGNECRQAGTPDCDNPVFTDPVAVYAHTAGNCSITGGETIPHPRLDGQEAVLYGDFCSGVIWMWDAQSGSQIIATTDLQISSFGRDADGVIYVSDYRKGQVLRLDNE